MNTAVAFLVFNRPETTQRVFEVIRQAKPKLFLVIADGARVDRPGEAERCAAVRAIIEQVDWDCKVLKNYADTNLGCRRRIASGLDWVFEQVEEAIILEDDCLPHLDFFPFCEELLERYRFDDRIAMISGNNFHPQHRRTDASYYFSRYTNIWGWATWRRAWQNFDTNLEHWHEVSTGNWLDDILQDQVAVKYWKKLFQETYEGKLDTWDTIWTFSCWIQHNLCINPSVNLVSNIGFHPEDSTHTKDVFDPFANFANTAIHFPLKHPALLIRDVEADKIDQRTRFATKNLVQKAVRKARKLLMKSWINFGMRSDWASKNLNTLFPGVGKLVNHSSKRRKG